MECLGVEGRLDETEGRLEMAPLTVGWGVSVELIGSVISPTLLPLSIVAGLVTLAIGVTGNIDCPFNWSKESEEHQYIFPSKLPDCASACSSK